MGYGKSRRVNRGFMSMGRPLGRIESDSPYGVRWESHRRSRVLPKIADAKAPGWCRVRYSDPLGVTVREALEAKLEQGRAIHTTKSRRAAKRGEMGEVVYVAYGSNINLLRMGERCSGARVHRRGHITRGGLMFGGGRGVMHLKQVKGEAYGGVPVACYIVNEADIESLDGFEGIHGGVYKRVAWVQNGKRHITYLMNNPGDATIPTATYWRTCYRGVLQWGLNAGAVMRAMGSAISSETSGAYALRRHEANYYTGVQTEIEYDDLPPVWNDEQKDDDDDDDDDIPDIMAGIHKRKG